ncbi:MAG: ABC transporter substrate-binding protein [Oscillospiraceae bacterium]
MKKLLCVLLLIIILCPFLTGCDEKTSKNTLTVYVQNRSNRSDIEAVNAKYKTLYPNVTLRFFELESLDWKSLKAKLHTELMSGRGPDILILNPNLFGDINKAMQAGAFCDLNEFLRNDAEYNADNYYQNVLSAGKYKDKQYVMPLSFNVPVLMTTQHMLKKSEFNPDNCNDYQGYISEVVKFIEKSKKGNGTFSLLGYNTDPPSFLQYIETNMFDYKDRIIDLKIDELRQICLDYKIYHHYRNTENEIVSWELGDVYNYLSQEKILFDCAGMNDSASDLFINAAMLNVNNVPVLLPIKDTQGRLNVEVTSIAAISNTCENKQNAYNYMKLLISPTVQATYPQNPVLKSALTDNIKLAKEQFKTGYLEDLGNAPVKPLNDSFYQGYLEIIESIDGAQFNNVEVNKIFYLAIEPYLNHKKSLDDCLKQAQDQLEIYISE